MEENVIIIGGSHAGSQLALSLRQGGWTGAIKIISDEAVYPYQHPPLSKDFLSGSKQFEDLLLRPKALYQKNNIEVLLNTTVLGVDRQQQCITAFINGTEQIFPYTKLAFCTGARVRRLPLPGSDLAGVHYLRTYADVASIKASLPHRGHGIIIGGGYIGLETAAMLRKMGHVITVLEAAPQLLGRVAAPEIGRFYQMLHEQHGVKIQTGVTITAISGEQAVTGVMFADGSQLTADFIVIGIGVVPNQELAQTAGLVVDDGIVVDQFARTADPNIVAAGDCTRFEDEHYGSIRLESVPNATEQAKVAAATLNGKPTPHHSLPWFWSDQYECKLQIAGISRGYDEIVVRGNPTVAADKKAQFCVFYFHRGQLIAADCINQPREFMLAKQWLQQRHTPEKTKLSDPGYALSKED